jgi:hypothetical protein
VKVYNELVVPEDFEGFLFLLDTLDGLVVGAH